VQNPHIFTYTQQFCQRYITLPRCQPVFPISDFLFTHKKNIDGNLMLLNFI